VGLGVPRPRVGGLGGARWGGLGVGQGVGRE
jgi:hypothetical protein